MIAVAYQRSSERFGIETDVMIEDFRTGFFYNGTIYNYSADGVYIETDYAPRPGRRVHLKVNGAYNIFDMNRYLAEIKWRRPLTSETSEYAFGMGMKYC